MIKLACFSLAPPPHFFHLIIAAAERRTKWEIVCGVGEERNIYKEEEEWPPFLTTEAPAQDQSRSLPFVPSFLLPLLLSLSLFVPLLHVSPQPQYMAEWGGGKYWCRMLRHCHSVLQKLISGYHTSVNRMIGINENYCKKL